MMDSPMFILAQCAGIGGMITMLLSFQTNRKKKLLWLQITSCVFYIIQYVLLGAISGCLVNLLALIRNYLYSRFKKVPTYLIAIFVTLAIIIGIFSSDGPIGFLPCLATVVFTIGLTSKNMTVVRLADLISCALYIAYNLNVGAYTGTIATLAELSSTLIAIARFDRKKLFARSKANRKA